MIKIRIKENDEGQRLDRFLRKYYKNASLSYVYKLLRTVVKVNDRKAPPNKKLLLGDEITIDISKDEEAGYLKSEKIKIADKKFTIAYEDENILAVIKPAGLLTHSNKKGCSETLVNQVLGYLINSGSYDPAEEKTFTPSSVNRLDRNTSGLVVFGKNIQAQRSLSQMFREEGSIRRFYLAIVFGELKASMLLDDRMVKDAQSNLVKIVNDDTGHAKQMKTKITPLKTANGHTLVEAELLTGRTHQIRVQLAKAGYPIVGDRKYGYIYGEAFPETVNKPKYQLLHAAKLEFSECVSPLQYLTGKKIVSDMPPHMKAIENILFN